MKTSIKNISLLCLVSVVGVATSLRGDEKAASFSSAQIQPTGLAATVLKVDQAKKSLTVAVKGKTITYKLSPGAKITENGRSIPLTDLTSGQQINLLAKPTVKGELQIVSLTVNSGVTANLGPTPEPTSGGNNKDKNKSKKNQD